MNILFQRLVLSRLWLTFVVLGVSFLAGALGTLNLVTLLLANLRLLHDFGWMAVMDGGLRQSIELLLQGLLSGVAYVVFKTCEHRLSDWLAHGTKAGARGDEAEASATQAP
jgi:hypothetical protein